ncbi:CaiB/BaiF CoA transferase family protein [Sphingomonas solaris]|uniref:CoA transferase n=1 Tax=Alterirhizorhabdus solaris TaxID=2529389 RepID=A0A558RBI4_9SPHN|nr:CoA transferase [Sphingomonas solaris]TVV76721.1 CoA transferase [Sphingomonas solaris]
MTDDRIDLPPLARTAARAPLDGIRVVDFTRVLAGPFGTQILGDLGAEVIKIENPQFGDDTRMIGPQASLGGEAPFFMSLNRSKQSVAIDLKSEAGRAVVLDLIGTADILVENFTASVMRRFALDYPSLRERFPKLIYCSVSGYGRTGRNADAPGYDSPVGAEAGVMSLNAYAGTAPVLGGLPFTDITTALNAAIGILAALQARNHSGLGQFVDVAMFDSALANLSFQGAEFLATGREPRLNTEQAPSPRGVFETADGRIIISCGNDKMFRAFCTVAERPEWLDDPRFATMAARMAHGEEILPAFRALFATRPSETWAAQCKAAGIPCGPVRTTGQALMSDQASERELVFGMPHPTAGTAPGIAQPFRFSETPCRYGAPPLLGEHTGAVLASLLGYDEARIRDLAAQGAIALGDQTSGDSARATA